MSEHTPEELHEFAAKHAPKLAEKITQLCGAVIARGMTGILEEVCRIQQEADSMRAVNAELLAALEGVIEAADSMRGTYGRLFGKTPEDEDTFIHEQWAEGFLSERADAARTAIAKANALKGKS